MLPSNYRTKKSERKVYPVVTDGFYQVALEDIKPVVNSDGSDALQFTFLILSEGQFLGQRLFKRVNPVINNYNNNPSWLFSFIGALNGVDPENESEVNGDVLNGLIGKQAMVMVKCAKKGDRTYSNIDGVVKATAWLPMPELKTSKPSEAPSPAQVAEPDDDEDLPF